MTEGHFKLLADTIPQLVWITGLAGEVKYINQRWFTYTGQPEAPWGRETWLAVTHPDDLERVYRAHEAALRAQQDFEVEYRLRRHDGAYRWHLARTVFVRDDLGKPVMRFGTATDIDDQKQIENRLQESLRVRDEFLSIASHELKTPLTSLKLLAELRSRSLARGDYSLFAPDKLHKMIDSDSRQVDRLTRLVEDMLDISRITTGKLAIRRERFDLCQLVRDLVDRNAAQFEAGGNSVHLDLPESLQGEWDLFRIEQVIMNLFTNAIRYGEGRPIHIRVEGHGNRATLSVRDQGRGIAAEDRERIFGRFERAVSPHEISGLGLGLYISRQIAELHGGTIRVESVLGQGAEFVVELPMA
jgi:PAS domain S-box-containing protein